MQSSNKGSANISGAVVEGIWINRKPPQNLFLGCLLVASVELQTYPSRPPNTAAVGAKC